MEHSVFTFLQNYLSDLHIQHVLTNGAGVDLSSLDLGLRNSILNRSKTAPDSPIKELEAHTIYHIVDYYECSYSFFQFPDRQILFIGPYLTKEFSFHDIHTLMNNLQIPAELFPQLQDYYYALPTVTMKTTFSSLLRHVYAGIFDTELPSVCYLDLKQLEPQEKFLETHLFFVPEDAILSMQLLEERYHMEDELLDAISHGNLSKALSVSGAMGAIRFAPRTDSELRNQKNLMITFNSLMRRSAYVAGVHPFYIDAVSSNYVTLIEQCRTVDEIHDIRPYMVQSYCDLVEKRSMSSYSEPVRKILVTVDASLTGDLSLKRFANDLFLNTSYLSTLFKKEVGMTLTDYVNKNRIAYAKKLLKSTTLSVQDVAIKCGISDIHYFTRLFRRETGKSPRKWRSQ